MMKRMNFYRQRLGINSARWLPSFRGLRAWRCLPACSFALAFGGFVDGVGFVFEKMLKFGLRGFILNFFDLMEKNREKA